MAGVEFTWIDFTLNPTMMRILRLATVVVATALGLAAPFHSGAQPTLPMKHTGKPTTTAITAADAMTRLYIFADDSMMGRRAGTPGDTKATNYIEREVRRMGLIPAGDNGTFFQAVPLYNRSLDFASKLSAGDTPLVAGEDYLPIPPEGTGRSLNDVQVIYVGNSADTTTLLPSSAGAGKAVMFAGPTGPATRRFPGAVAYLIVRPDATLGQVRAFIQGTTQHLRSPSDTTPVAMSIVVPASKASALLGIPLENARPGTVGRTLRGAITYKADNMPGRNVVAILPGSDAKLKNQYVAIGAHSDHEGIRRQGPLDHDSLRAYNKEAARIYIARTGELPGFPGSGLTPAERATIKLNLDSMRRMRPARLDSIFNGADDDGSGSVGMLEVAEKFAGARVKPKRSLLFVWHTAEESGLFGSHHFTDYPTVPRDSIVAQVNIDMMGRGQATDAPGGGPDYLQLLGSRRLSTEYGDLIEEVNKLPSNNFKLDYRFDANGHPQQYYCRSDHYEYARYGIPIVFMGTGGHADYHQVTDEPQYINYPHLAKVASFVADVAERVANRDQRLVVDKPKPDPKGQCVQ